MNHESQPQPAPKNYAEMFGFTEDEQLFYRVSKDRFQELLLDEGTCIHAAKESGNSYGEFLFVTVSRPGSSERIGITFYGLGYHEYRERVIQDEWYWYRATPDPERNEQEIPKAEMKEILAKRAADIGSQFVGETQSQAGALFEMLAELTDEDGALAELEDLGWSLLGFSDEADDSSIPQPAPLMDEKVREALPGLYSQEELGLKALARVKYFTPDSNWTWYATEFDGEDVFFGLVNGFELELGYFSLKELNQACGPLGLPIERDIYFEPKSLEDLMQMHRQEGSAS
jgi:hypothetical protein